MKFSDFMCHIVAIKLDSCISIVKLQSIRKKNIYKYFVDTFVILDGLWWCAGFFSPSAVVAEV